MESACSVNGDQNKLRAKLIVAAVAIAVEKERAKYDASAGIILSFLFCSGVAAKAFSLFALSGLHTLLERCKF